MQERKKLNRDINKLDSRRVQLGVFAEKVIRQQSEIISVAEKGIDKINGELETLRGRMEPYVTKTPKPRDEKYYRLKGMYETRVRERESLQKAIQIAEESIASTRLSRIPGEDYARGT